MNRFDHAITSALYEIKSLDYHFREYQQTGDIYHVQMLARYANWLMDYELYPMREKNQPKPMPRLVKN